ncbi:MAG: adenine phosphoribosyltransferase [Bacteroidales bacterium]|nr:adenine phosphoribosyltransferase [Bacteroidales bacterium]
MCTITSNDSLKKAIRNIPDFPVKGIQFKDITTLLKDPYLFNYAVNTITDYYFSKGITKVIAIESRGFIAGGAVASRLNAGFIPIRKPGKLPFHTYSVTYQLEYGTDTQEIHQDALHENDVVLLHDDLLATGGTTLAAIELIKKFGVKTIFLNYIVELDFLGGREKIGNNFDIFTLVHY